MDGFTREILKRLPLAQALLGLFRYTLTPQVLNELYAKHRGRHYERVLAFSVLVDLMGDALLQYRGSGNQAFVHAQEQGRLPVSRQAAYGKLGRMPLAVSIALVATSHKRLDCLRPPAAAWEKPATMSAMTPIIIDGKVLKHLAKKLEVAWGVPGTVLGGRLLVAWNASTELAVAMNADEDGESNDVPMVADLVPQVRAQVPGPILWIDDRQFCNMVALRQMISREGDHFVTRYAASLSFHRDRSRSKRRGRDELGRAYWEEWGWLGMPDTPGRLYVRRITVRTGKKTSVKVVTDLLDEEVGSPVEVLTTYRRRGGIEHAFQQITEVFHLEHLIGCTPEASVFQAAFCLAIYNMLQVMRSHVADAQKLSPGQVSLEGLFDETQRDLVAAMQMVGLNVAGAAVEVIEEPEAMRRRLRELLKNEWHFWWKKAPAKRRSKPKVKGRSGQHTSMQRLIEAAKAKELNRKRRRKRGKPPRPRGRHQVVRKGQRHAVRRP